MTIMIHDCDHCNFDGVNFFTVQSAICIGDFGIGGITAVQLLYCFAFSKIFVCSLQCVALNTYKIMECLSVGAK